MVSHGRRIRTLTQEIYQGLQAYQRANRFVFKHRLWPYLILPGLLSLAYFPIIIFLAYVYLGDLATFVHAHLIPSFLRWKATVYMLAAILWIITLLLAYMSYKYVVMIFFSPVLGHLSEVTEKKTLGTEPPTWNFKGFIHDLVRALIINLRAIILTILLTSFAWLTVFIPVAGAIISPILMFLIQFYYTGCGLIDPTLERKKYSVRESVRFASDHRAAVTGLGLGFTLLLMIPMVGWYLAPSYGTIAGTISTLELLSNKSKK